MTNEQRFETLYILEASQEELAYMIEKRTRDEYAREKFKKKYKFVPDKPGSNKGTITINGEKRHIDMGKSKFIERDDDLLDRVTSANVYGKNGEIVVDKNFFKLKNAKRRDAVLQHEMGHTKLHSTRGDSATADPRSFSQKNRGIARRNLVNSLKEGYGYDEHHKPDKATKELLGEVADVYVSKRDKRYAEKSEKNPYRKKRDELLKQAGKYRVKSASHANEQEFEADRYAANKSGAKNVKRSAREYVRKDKKTTKKLKGFDKLSKEEIKKQNKTEEADLKARSKALKDKKLRDAELYK